MAATKSRSSRSGSRKASTRRAATGSRKTTAKKRTTPKKSAASRSARRGSGKRDTVKAKNATFYARRSAGGEFREMDEKGRSLSADRRQRAKSITVSGMGDRGDRRTKKR